MSTPVIQLVHVTAGGWRTLHTFFRTEATGVFRLPAGAHIKVRYGVGILGWDGQKQTLDGTATRQLEITKGASTARARMQIRVPVDTDVEYTLLLTGP